MRTRWFGATLCCVFALALLEAAAAEVGGTARPGDNCSPVNGIAVGYAIPIGGQIVDQDVLLANGWQTIGWALHDSRGAWWLSPFYAFGTSEPPGSGGGVVSLAGPDHDSVVKAYDAYNKLYPGFIRTRANLDRLLIAPCFTKPWGGPYLLKPNP